MQLVLRKSSTPTHTCFLARNIFSYKCRNKSKYVCVQSLTHVRPPKYIKSILNFTYKVNLSIQLSIYLSISRDMKVCLKFIIYIFGYQMRQCRVKICLNNIVINLQFSIYLSIPQQYIIVRLLRRRARRVPHSKRRLYALYPL